MFAQLRRWSDAAEAFVTLHRIVPLLLVDDWGAGYEAAGAVAGFSRLIEDRYAHRRATCISTNMSAADLDAAPEWERVRDRLRERCILVQLTGGTRRRPEWKKEE
jgi:DNA replication protein DnaC